jgi:hypothetical protein
MCLPQNYNQQCGDEKNTKSQKMEKKIQPTTTTLMISDSVSPKAALVAVATAETIQLSTPPPTTTEVEAAMQSVQFCHRQIRPLAGTQTQPSSEAHTAVFVAKKIPPLSASLQLNSSPPFPSFLPPSTVAAKTLRPRTAALQVKP